MFVLQNEEHIKPFAIVADGDDKEKFERAVREEYALIFITLGEIKLPDWGMVEYFDYEGEDENGTFLKGRIQVTKLVTY